MITLIPCLEIMKAVTDMNITSADSKVRVNAFREADLLANPKNKDVSLVIEGNIFQRISPRLESDHKKALEDAYEIEDSALGTPNYNITKAIKFITTEKKLKISDKNKVIIITENVKDFEEFEHNSRVRVVTPHDFMSKIGKYDEIKENYDTKYGAVVTAFFIEA